MAADQSKSKRTIQKWSDGQEELLLAFLKSSDEMPANEAMAAAVNDGHEHDRLGPACRRKCTDALKHHPSSAIAQRCLELGLGAPSWALALAPSAKANADTSVEQVSLFFN